MVVLRIFGFLIAVMGALVLLAWVGPYVWPFALIIGGLWLAGRERTPKEHEAVEELDQTKSRESSEQICEASPWRKSPIRQGISIVIACILIGVGCYAAYVGFNPANLGLLLLAPVMILVGGSLLAEELELLALLYGHGDSQRP